MLLSLALPIGLSGIALFVAYLLSCMVLQLHKEDWRKLEKEEEFMAAAEKCNIPVGSYMFPCAESAKEMQSEDFQKKYDAGPRGILTMLPNLNMGVIVVLTFLYFLGVSFMLAYLATIALKPGAGFLPVFRFVFTAGFMTFFAAILQHAIWFRPRIVGHLIDSLAYAAIVATLFASFWPSA